MKTRKAILAALAVLSMLGVSAVTADAAGKRSASYDGPMVDLQPGVSNDTDGAYAFARITVSASSSNGRYKLRFLPIAADGSERDVIVHNAGPDLNVPCDSPGGPYEDVIGGPEDETNQHWMGINGSTGAEPGIQVGTRQSGVGAVPWAYRADADVVIVVYETAANGGLPVACIPIVLPYDVFG